MRGTQYLPERQLSGLASVNVDSNPTNNRLPGADYVTLGDLITQYVDWCRERYAGHEDIVEAAFGAQDLATELRSLADKYGPPSGRAFLARDGDAERGPFRTGQA